MSLYNLFGKISNLIKHGKASGNRLEQGHGYDFNYENISLLEGAVLENAEGNRLTVRKDGQLQDFYLHAPFGALSLTREPAYDENVICFYDGDKIDPFKLFEGRKIDGIDKFYSTFTDRFNDIPWMAYVSAEGHPVCLGVSGGDDTIIVNIKPSNRYILGRVVDITENEDWSDENIDFMKQLEKMYPFVFDEEALEQMPELHKKIRG